MLQLAIGSPAQRSPYRSDLLEIEFLGGASEVGRSSILLRGEKKILLDCGIKVDHGSRNAYPMPAGPVDAFILSHAHLDHSGFAPSLYLSRNPVSFGTQPTLNLSELLIEDSMKIERETHNSPKFFNRQLKAFRNNYIGMEYGKEADFTDLTISFSDAGHIPGSAVTSIQNSRTDRRLVYTGDFRLEPQMLHGGAKIAKSDVLITESTYSTSDHPDRTDVISEFVEDVKAVVETRGTALLPCFAVGRAQELLAVLQSNGLMENTFIDGMAKAATSIILQDKGFISNAGLLQEAWDSVVMVDGPAQRKAALRGGSVVVTTAGMLNGGPIMNYITRANDRSKVFLTGYQADGTNGRKITEGRQIDVNGRKFKLRIPHAFYDFSAHAGRSEILRYVKESSPETVFCVHGDRENTNHLAEELRSEGYDAYSPMLGDRVRIEF